MSYSLDPLLTMLAGQIPYFIVWVIGLIVALVNWSKYPRPALLTTLAVVIMFGASVVYSFLWWQVIVGRAEFGDQGFALKMTILGWGRSILGAITYGMLFWAVFGWRRTFSPSRRPPLPEQEEAEAAEQDQGSTDIRTERRDRE
jgi:hypothetical protein